MGTMDFETTVYDGQTDHPHAYGDKKRIFLICAMNTGSSPRVWGQGPHGRYTACDYGIIPTRMGTRIYANENIMTCEDHPHAYGDKNPLYNKSVVKEGSSPRVWGQEKRHEFHY